MSTAAVAGRHPPGPRGLPILGMLLAIQPQSDRRVHGRGSRFGEVVYFKIGPRRGYLDHQSGGRSPRAPGQRANYHKSPLYDKLRQSLGNGLLTSEDAFWLRQRRIAQPAFHRQRIAALAGIMAERACARLPLDWQRHRRDGQPVDIGDEMMRLTRTVVLRTLLGADLGPFTARSTGPGT